LGAVVTTMSIISIVTGGSDGSTGGRTFAPVSAST